MIELKPSSLGALVLYYSHTEGPPMSCQSVVESIQLQGPLTDNEIWLVSGMPKTFLPNLSSAPFLTALEWSLFPTLNDFS